MVDWSSYITGKVMGMIDGSKMEFGWVASHCTGTAAPEG
jgi:hypothetical protein